MTRGGFEVRGADELERLGRALKETGDKELRKELLAGIRKEGKPAIKEVKDHVRDFIPKRGGLADSVKRSSIGVRTRMSGKNVGIQIKGTGKNVRNLKRLNAGFVRHPVYGKDVWVEQRIEPGFFDKPLEQHKPKIVEGVKKVLSDIASRIERNA